MNETVAINVNGLSTIWNAFPRFTKTEDTYLWQDRLLKDNLLAWSEDVVVSNNSIDHLHHKIALSLIDAYILYLNDKGN